MHIVNKTKLKGGSLSGTYLCHADNGDVFVRKQVSLIENREYGFQRWYSQLKRMQRYNVMFPGVFPDLKDYGMIHDKEHDEIAYFDMNYVPDAITCQEFLLRNHDSKKIDLMLDSLLQAMSQLHKVSIASTTSPMILYIREEMEQKFKACQGNQKFDELYDCSEIVFNGVVVPGLRTMMKEFMHLISKNYQNVTETFTHGNITLENVLYQPTQNRIVFIDPYEENIIDSVLAEYSQIRQSCNSKYEMYNSASVQIEDNHINCKIDDSPGLDYFNDRFTEFLQKNYSESDMTVIRLLEISQFVRMLPFKMAIDEDKMLFFYGLASYLFHQLLIEGRGQV